MDDARKKALEKAISYIEKSSKGETVDFDVERDIKSVNNQKSDIKFAKHKGYFISGGKMYRRK